MYSVGLMSGTSLDGIDAALVKIDGYGLDTKVKLIDFITLDIDPDIKEEIRKCCSVETSSVDTICSLNFKMGYLFSDAVKKVCEKAKFDVEKLDFIASHGQTIYHIPQASKDLARSTMQIGEAAVIAYETKTKVISNFRVMDIAAGGEGAPLVPHTEFLLYSNKDKNIALQNIGGIGNVTVIPNTNKIDDIFAFDTGPGNMIIDEVCQRLFNKKYDENGSIAALGTVSEEMLTDLMNNDYFYKQPPKTTGREVFGKEYVDRLLEKYNYIKPEDIMATVTMFTAKTIAVNYEQFIMKKLNLDVVVIGGGGAHNKTLMSNLSNLLPSTEIITQEEYGFSSDAKEAIAFVVLGNETLNSKPSNVLSATGASKRVILGNITPNPFGE